MKKVSNKLRRLKVGKGEGDDRSHTPNPKISTASVRSYRPKRGGCVTAEASPRLIKEVGLSPGRPA